MTLLLTGVAGAFGLAIGSFLNVVIHRVPLGMSIVRPPSACPGCGAGIRRRDNVPVLSWIMLGGRCRDCRTRISARYPAIEIVTGAAFLGIALALVPGIVRLQDPRATLAAILYLIALLYAAAISVTLAMIDLDVHRLPNSIVLPAYPALAILLTAAAIVGGEPQRLVVALIGGAGSVLFYGLLAVLYPGGMGMGDVKLSGVLGLLLGYSGLSALVVGVGSAFLLGGLAGIALIAARRASRGSGIPFGPWMLVGLWIGIFAGAPIAAGYLSLVGLN